MNFGVAVTKMGNGQAQGTEGVRRSTCAHTSSPRTLTGVQIWTPNFDSGRIRASSRCRSSPPWCLCPSPSVRDGSGNIWRRHSREAARWVELGSSEPGKVGKTSGSRSDDTSYETDHRCHGISRDTVSEAWLGWIKKRPGPSLKAGSTPFVRAR